MQTYQRESKPIQDVYAQVTQLFNTAPDLLEDFKQFLPESAAAAKAQAARQAAEDAAIVSNVRGEPSYNNAGQVARAQTPRSDVKMPPLGQFPPPSHSKENKKRRGGPGAQVTLGTGAQASSSLADPVGAAQSNRSAGLSIGNVNKVSESLFPRVVASLNRFKLRFLLRPHSFVKLPSHPFPHLLLILARTQICRIHLLWT